MRRAVNASRARRTQKTGSVRFHTTIAACRPMNLECRRHQFCGLRAARGCWRAASDEREGPSMISGECRVDAIPPADGMLAGHRLSIDGLRLRLDLRIVPAADGADGA